MEFEADNQKQKEIFAKNLQYWLKMKNKTQMDLMNDLKLSSSTVSDWCNAKKYPRMGTVQMLADYLGILKSDLVDEKTFNQDTPEIRAIARDIAKLNPEKKELFISLLKQMSDEANKK